jgi:hypothetical protein
MGGLVCPHCGELIEVFTPVAPARSIWSSGVTNLGRIPLDPALGSEHGLEAQREAFAGAAGELLAALDRPAAA